MIPNEIHLTLCELQAAGRLTLAGFLLPVVSLLDGVCNNGTAPAYYVCTGADMRGFFNTVFKITSEVVWR